MDDEIRVKVNPAVMEPLTVWTIYAAPADYPSVPFVVRGWRTSVRGDVVDTGMIGFADTLDQARAYLPEGLYCVGRSDDDEPQIVESWL